MNPVPAFPSVADAMADVQAGLRFVADADATTMSAQAQADCLQMMERANAIVTAAPGLGPERVHLGPGVQRGRGLQPAGLADPQDPGHQGRRGGAYRGFAVAENAAYVETAVAGQVFEDAEVIADLLTRFDTLRNEASGGQSP